MYENKNFPTGYEDRAKTDVPNSKRQKKSNPTLAKRKYCTDCKFLQKNGDHLISETSFKLKKIFSIFLQRRFWKLLGGKRA